MNYSDDDGVNTTPPEHDLEQARQLAREVFKDELVIAEEFPVRGTYILRQTNYLFVPDLKPVTLLSEVENPQLRFGWRVVKVLKRQPGVSRAHGVASNEIFPTLNAAVEEAAQLHRAILAVMESLELDPKHTDAMDDVIIAHKPPDAKKPKAPDSGKFWENN
jgi:hypothetical protein